MIAWVAALLAAAGTAAPQPAPVPPGVRVEHRPGITALYAEAPGRILSVVTPRAPAAGDRVILLVAPAAAPKPKENEAAPASPPPPKDPCADPGESSAAAAAGKPRLLIEVDPAGDGALRTLRSDLPEDASGLLAADVDGDGRADLVLARAHSISVLLGGAAGDWPGPLEEVVAVPGAELGSARIGASAGAAGATLWMIDLGAVRTFARNAGGGWRELPRIPVPLTAAKKEASLVLTGVRVDALDPRDPLSPLATAPEPLGGDRLRTLVFRPGAAEAERSAECWSRLPAAEKLLGSQYLTLAGAPALLVATRPADKLSFFGEQLVRLFPLASDRTRKGRAPAAAFESGANLWQKVHAAAADVSGDGREDLVVGYWKGLKDDTVVLEAYLARADGTFESKARTTEFDVESADRAVLAYGDNLDGTGLPDLVLLANHELNFYPGAAAADAGRRLVATRPLWSIPAPGAVHVDHRMEVTIDSDGMETHSVADSGWSFRPIDVNADGRPELLCAPEPGATSRSVVLVRRD